MKTADILILVAAAAAVAAMVKLSRVGASSAVSSAGRSLVPGRVSAIDPYGAMTAVTDVERPLFLAAGLGDNPTLDQQTMYYYKDGF